MYGQQLYFQTWLRLPFYANYFHHWIVPKLSKLFSLWPLPLKYFNVHEETELWRNYSTLMHAYMVWSTLQFFVVVFIVCLFLYNMHRYFGLTSGSLLRLSELRDSTENKVHALHATNQGLIPPLPL